MSANETFTRYINIYIDSGDAQKSYDILATKRAKMDADLDQLRIKQKKAMDEVAAGNTKAQTTVDALTQKIVKSEAAIDTVTKAMDRQQKKITGELAPSFRDLQSTVANLGRELKKMSEQDDGFAEKKARYNEAKTALDKYSFSLVSVRNGLSDLLKTAKGVAVGTLIGNTTQAIAASVMNQISGTIDAVAKRSDQEADIRKTTGLNNDQVKEVRGFFKDLDTRTGNDKLAQYASEAGKLGKESVEDIKAFVDQANQISVALGEDLGQDAINQIGKIADIFDTSMLKIGSSINTVGQSSSASEAYITDFLFRMSGIGKTANISASDLLGFGAVLDMNGQQVEAASTSLQKFFIDFVKNSEQFGKSAGMAKGSLSALINEQGVNTAFLEFLKNLKATTTSSDDFLKKLDEIGIDGSRGASTFLTLANNISEVEKQQKIAGKSFAEGTSITAEYAIRNENLAAQIERLKKAWSSLFSSNEATAGVSALINLGTRFLEVLKAIPGWISKNANALIIITTATILYNKALIVNRVEKIAGLAVDVAAIATEKARALWKGITTAATNLQSLAEGVLTGRITAAIIVQRIQNALSIASGNIFTFLVTVITLAAGAMALYYNNLNKALQTQKMLNEVKAEAAKHTIEEKASLDTLLIVARDETIAKEKRLEAIKKINEISPEYLGNLTLENISNAKGIELIGKYIKALDEKSTAEAIQNKMVELKTKLIDINNQTTDESLTYMNRFTGLLYSQIDPLKAANYQMKQAAQNRADETKQIDGQIRALESQISLLYRGVDASKAYTTSIGTVNSDGLLELDANRGSGKSTDGNKDPETKKEEEKAAAAATLKIASDVRKKNLEEVEKFYADVAKLEAESEKLKLTADEREIADVRAKYAILEKERKRLDDAGLLSDQVSYEKQLRLEQLFTEELSRIQSKQFEKRSADEYEASLKALDRFFAEEKQKQAEAFSKGQIDQASYNQALFALDKSHKAAKVATAEDYVATVKKAEEDLGVFRMVQYQDDIEANRRAAEQKRADQISLDNAGIINAQTGGNPGAVRDAKRKALIDDMEFEINLVSTTEARKAEILAKYNADYKAIQNEYTQQIIGSIGQYAGAVVNLASSFANILDNVEAAALNKEKKKHTESVKSYKRQLDQKMITEYQYNALVSAANERMDKEEREMKRKAFNRNKAIKLASAIIDTALGVARALSENTWPYSLIPAAAVGIAGGIQVGVIAAEQPQYAKGGIAQGGSHAQGGISMIDSRTGRKVGEMEGDEPYMILSKATMANNGPLINDLLDASMNGGGRKVKPQYYMPKNINATRAFENITYAGGGIQFDGEKSRFVSNSTSADVSLEAMSSMELLKSQRETNRLLKVISEKETGTTITDFKKQEKLYKYMLDKNL